jgi:prevent-host-death family protein
MARYSVTEARTKLSKLLDLALAGEEVIITRRGEEIATISPRRGAPAVAFGPEWFKAHQVVPQNSSSEFDAVGLVRRMRDEGY